LTKPAVWATTPTMDALWISTLIVAIAEIGDKTQLLAIVLACRFQKPVPIILGILVATLANHGLAAGLGYWLANIIEGKPFQLAVGISFIAMAAWALIPDSQDDDAATKSHGGVFLTTLVAFFLVEIGDKTQIATTLLAARFQEILLVTIGTALGMMLANVPAVYLGQAATKVLPLKVVRTVAAALFALIGVWVLIEALRG
jgi:Ca2+/H+ antiporter, TMEM165/GDT1 family